MLGAYVPLDSEKGNKDPGQAVWMDNCRRLLLSLDVDNGKNIQVMRLSRAYWLAADCAPLKKQSPWKTGRGLRIGDDAQRILQLYGNPTSRSPSTKDGESLELWYYAFDWAGPDVPQVMEVVCTVPKDGAPGRVVEITLAAGSL